MITFFGCAGIGPSGAGGSVEGHAGGARCRHVREPAAAGEADEPRC